VLIVFSVVIDLVGEVDEIVDEVFPFFIEWLKVLNVL
jgi:hypothetical protein